MSTYQHNCNSDYRNEGWSFTGSGVNACYKAWGSIGDDTKYCSNPASKGRGSVQFPVDLTTSAFPDGSLITGVTLYVRAKKTDSASRPLTVNFMCKDDTSRFTSRTVYPTQTITTIQVATFKHDALGYTWTKDRVDRIMAQVFSTCGSAGKVNVYELYAVVNYRVKPTVRLTSPTGNVTSPPTVTWTYAQADGDPQKKAAYKIFTAVQQSDRTFNPNSSASLFVATSVYTVKLGDTLSGIAQALLGDESLWIDLYNANLSVIGSNPDLIYPNQVLNIPGISTVNGDITTVVAPFTLAPGDYYVYVQAESSFGGLSDWSGRAFSISGSAPGVPGGGTGGNTGAIGTGGGGGFESVISDPATSSVQLTFRDGSNLLSPQQSDFDTDTSVDSIGYVATNATISQDQGNSYTGGASLAMKCVAAGTMSVETPPVEIQAGAPLTARAQFLAIATSRTVGAVLHFYDGSFTELMGTTIVASITDVTGTWTEAVATGNAPTGAVFSVLRLHVTTPATNEIHNVDAVGIMHGSNSSWSNGGHASRNLLSSLASMGSDGSSVPWTPNSATTVAAANATGTGNDGPRLFAATYAGISPSISYVSTGTAFTDATTGSGFTLNKPASVADGDLLVAYVASDLAQAAPAPTGWTAITSQTSGSGSSASSLTVMMRDALAADPSTWVGDLVNNATRKRTTVVCYRGAASTATQFENNSINGGNTGSFTSLNETTPTINNTDPNAWRLSAFAIRDDATGGTMVANTSAPGVVPGISYVGAAGTWKNPSGENTSFKINRPANVQSGDLMIAGVALIANVTVTAPSGWTIIRTVHDTIGAGDQHSGSTTLCTMYRFAGASEPTSWTGSHTSSIFPKLSQAVAYRNVNATQFVAENGATGTSTSMDTATITNTDSRAWRICMFAPNSAQGSTQDSNETAERVDGSSTGYGTSNGYQDVGLGVFDSNGTVSTGSHQRTGYAATADGHGLDSEANWIGLIKPLAAAPGGPSNETERQDATAGSSSYWLTLAAYDTNGVAATGNTSVTGIFTAGSGTSVLSSNGWIGYLAPASPVTGGDISVTLTTPIDITKINPAVLARSGRQITVQSGLAGSTSGVAYLTLFSYVGNELISQQMAPASSFGAVATDPWAKSAVTFPLPDGTTRVGMGILVPDRAVSDIVYFDRAAMSFGSDNTYRPGTGRAQHPIFSIPLLEYAEDPGTGYGDWSTLYGSDKANLTYDPLSGESTFTDPTITPLTHRKYRIRTVSYGLGGEIFTSDYGPESPEAYLAAPDFFWLKDLVVPDYSMPLKVKVDSMTVTTQDTSTVFNPVGENRPIIVTQGYVGDQIALTVIVNKDDYVLLRRVLNSGHTLFLQSDTDQAWWVKPQGNITADIQSSNMRRTNPIRFVNLTLLEVSPSA